MQPEANLYKDAFISYGRRESLFYVARLHQQLVSHGKSAWFDKVNIPAADDFVEQIHLGIRNAQNFIFVIAPGSLTSKFCCEEAEYAASMGKRIIPLVHIDETAEARANYSAEEKLYRDRIFEVLGRRNWIFAREKAPDPAQMQQLAKAQESKWQRHEDPVFLKEWQCPLPAEPEDDREKVLEKLLHALNREQQYVYWHTVLLEQAWEWDNKGQFTKDLLVGKERKEAEDWLKREFRSEQPPCLPTDLHARYISASRKNAHNLMTEVFMSYSLKDQELMRQVNNSLEHKAVTTWLHSHDIEKNKQFESEIQTGIEQADNILFFLSEESLRSDWCLKELTLAYQLHKRIIPLKVGQLDTKAPPPAHLPAEQQETLRHLFTLQFVDFTDNESGRTDDMGKTDYERDIEAILREIAREKQYHQQHKILLVQALRWQRKKNQSSFLLNGHNLNKALVWLRINNDRKELPPTDLHREFIEVSQQSKGLYPTEVFISYSRKDSDLARKLNQRLQESNRFTWFDQESIASGVDFEEEIFKGIERSQNFLFIISPDATASAYCERELQHAAALNKRFIPVFWKACPQYIKRLPKAWQNTQWIDFGGQDFDKAFMDLRLLLDTDREHVEQHLKWQQRALEWENNRQSEDFLLNTSAFTAAKSWLASTGIDLPEVSDKEAEQQIKLSTGSGAWWYERVIYWLLSRFPMFWRGALSLLVYMLFNILYFVLPFKFSRSAEVNMLSVLVIFSVFAGYMLLVKVPPLKQQGHTPKPPSSGFGRLKRIMVKYLSGLSHVVLLSAGFLLWIFFIIVLDSLNLLGNTAGDYKEGSIGPWSLIFGYFAVVFLVWAFSTWRQRLRNLLHIGQQTDAEAESRKKKVPATTSVENLLQASEKSPSPTRLQYNFILASSKALAFARAQENIISTQLDHRLRNVKLALACSVLFGFISAVAGILAWDHSEKADDALLFSNELINDYLQLGRLVYVQGSSFTAGEGNLPENSQNATVNVGSFYISRNEVTVAQFRQYCIYNRMDMPVQPEEHVELHPVVNISWYDALNYCNWLSLEKGLEPVYNSEKFSNIKNFDVIEFDEPLTVNTLANGYRLPTEAEWVCAALLGRSTEDKLAPFISKKQKNAKVNLQAATFNGGFWPGEKVVQVDSLPLNSLQTSGMNGNVAEWCFDGFGQEEGGSAMKVTRYFAGYLAEGENVSPRDSLEYFATDFSVGFRLARSAEQEPPQIQ